jgi:hypothetical protein
MHNGVARDCRRRLRDRCRLEYDNGVALLVLLVRFHRRAGDGDERLPGIVFLLVGGVVRGKGENALLLPFFVSGLFPGSGVREKANDAFGAEFSLSTLVAVAVAPPCFFPDCS